MAHSCHANLLALLDRLKGVSGVRRLFASPAFHEATLSLAAPASSVLDQLCDQGLLAGLDLCEFYPELGDAVLVCTTETKTPADLDRYARSLAAVLAAAPAAAADLPETRSRHQENRMATVTLKELRNCRAHCPAKAQPRPIWCLPTRS